MDVRLYWPEPFKSFKLLSFSISNRLTSIYVLKIETGNRCFVIQRKCLDILLYWKQCKQKKCWPNRKDNIANVYSATDLIVKSVEFRKEGKKHKNWFEINYCAMRSNRTAPPHKANTDEIVTDLWFVYLFITHNRMRLFFFFGAVIAKQRFCLYFVGTSESSDTDQNVKKRTRKQFSKSFSFSRFNVPSVCVRAICTYYLALFIYLTDNKLENSSHIRDRC